MKDRWLDILKEQGVTPRVGIDRFDGCMPVDGTEQDVCGSPLNLTLDAARWSVAFEAIAVADRSDAIDLTVRFRLEEGDAPQTRVSLALAFDGWSRDAFVLMPAAVYDGNRFESRKMAYPPMNRQPEDLGPDISTRITDVPRLEIGDGPSRIQQLTGDLATPAVGIRRADGKGFWLLTEQATAMGDSGLELEESADRSRAVLSVTAPGIRYPTRYIHCDMGRPSEDRGCDVHPGETVVVHVRLHFFDCPSVPALVARFAEIRKDLAPPAPLHHELPFSSAWEIQEEKYNRENWVESKGYYAVDSAEGWQVGWVGGLMVTFPLLLAGSALSRVRALRNFDFAFREGQSDSGFFLGSARPDGPYSDCFWDPTRPWHLIRKSSDALYFLFKQYELLAKRMPDFTIPKVWRDGTRRCADAFVRLWERYGQFGQFVDTTTGDLLVGGSTSAGIAPAALALAARFFGEPRYLLVAEESAEAFFHAATERGCTTGGPGEALQCPDSESAFGLLESFVVLFEETGAPVWLERARAQADLCATWCVSYDFAFPPASTFGRLDMRTTGTVYANVQNKHSAPGICTLSGDTLFKLYRATGETRYLELIRDIAHAMPQYISREDRPIRATNGQDMPVGWINERVEMSDWLEPVGEIFYGSCWCEVSNMLTYAAVPGLYIQIDTGFFLAIDQIDAEMVEDGLERLCLRLLNPTAFPAKVRVFAERTADMGRLLGQVDVLRWPVMDVPAQGTVELEYDRWIP